MLRLQRVETYRVATEHDLGYRARKQIAWLLNILRLERSETYRVATEHA
jgi:hypothetical protein